MGPSIPEDWLADIVPAGWRPLATHFAFTGPARPNCADHEFCFAAASDSQPSNSVLRPRPATLPSGQYCEWEGVTPDTCRIAR
jgi:hypothetical protein